MSLFRKIFGPKSDESQEHLKNEERSKYMPDIKLPIDERFTINFKANGGKFLYCEDIDEVNDNLKLIITENDWEDANVMLLDNRLAEKFKSHKLKINNRANDCAYFLSTCEYHV